MGVIDRNKGGSVTGSEGGTTRLLKNPAFSPMASTPKGAFNNLHTVAEHEVRLPLLPTRYTCLLSLNMRLEIVECV